MMINIVSNIYLQYRQPLDFGGEVWFVLVQLVKFFVLAIPAVYVGCYSSKYP